MDANTDTTTTTSQPWSDDFVELYHNHFDRLVHQLERQFRCRDLAMDAVQDAFLAIYAKGCVAAPGRELAYVATAARNKAREVLRTEKRRQQILAENRLVAPDAPSAESVTLRDCQARSIAEGIATLPSQQGRTFVLRHVRGLSVSETADELGVSPGTVKTHTHRAVQSMRESQQQIRWAA